MSKSNTMFMEKEENIGAALTECLLLCEEVYKVNFGDVINAYNGNKNEY